MKSLLFFSLILTLFITACSEDDSKTGKKVIEVETKVQPTAQKEEALVCIDAEKKITCKLMTKRLKKDRNVVFRWMSPDNRDNRIRELVLPAGHASVYDIRYKEGRSQGMWRVTAEVEGETVSAEFRI